MGRLWTEAGILPLVEFSIFPEQTFHTPLRCEVSDNHVPCPALHSFLPCLPLSLPDFFLFLFFSFRFAFFLFKSIKISSHKHLQDFLLEKCHHCHCFLCYFVFMELLYPVIWLHFFCYFTFLTISKSSSINFPISFATT